MPIDLYPNIAKIKRNGVYQNLPGFIGQTPVADVEAMIANSETNTTAQYVHPKDSYFILNNILYQADLDISVNDIIAVGTNCHISVLSDDVFNLIKNIAEVERNSDYYFGRFIEENYTNEDKEGYFWYINFPVKANTTISLTASHGSTIYLRTGKNVTPSLQTLSVNRPNVEIDYLVEHDIEWFVISSTISDAEVYSIIIKDQKEAKLPELEHDVDYTILDSKSYFNTSADWMQGNIGIPSSNKTSLTTSANRITSKTAKVESGDKFKFTCPTGTKYRVIFLDNAEDFTSGVQRTVITGGYNDGTTWHTDNRILTVPEGAKGMAIACAYTNDANLTPSAAPLLTIYFYSIENRLQALENVISTNEQITYAGKRISILGDSISTFAGDDASTADDGHKISDGTYTYLGNHCRYPLTWLTNVNDTYWKKLIDNLGMTLGVNDSWAGSRVAWNGTEDSDQGANIYIASQTRINHLGLNGTPDYILVNAGTNDIYASTLGTFNTENPVNYTDQEIAALPVNTFADGYRALLIRLQKTYPLAKIVVMLPNYTTSYYNPTKADQYLEVIKEACDFFGVPWIDMRTVGVTMYNTATYLGDGIHPNVAGMNLLYQKLYKAFLYSI